jgi:hypothetical protein
MVSMTSRPGEVLDTIDRTLLTPERLEAIAARAVAAQRAGESADARRTRLERQFREAKAKMDRYVRVIGEGLDLAEIREQLTTVNATVATLEVQLAALAAPAPVDIERIRTRVADWRGILRRGPAMARQILRKIIPGKLALTPTDDGVSFRGRAAWTGLFEDTVYGRLVVAPG